MARARTCRLRVSLNGTAGARSPSAPAGCVAARPAVSCAPSCSSAVKCAMSPDESDMCMPCAHAGVMPRPWLSSPWSPVAPRARARAAYARARMRVSTWARRKKDGDERERRADGDERERRAARARARARALRTELLREHVPPCEEGVWRWQAAVQLPKERDRGQRALHLAHHLAVRRSARDGATARGARELGAQRGAARRGAA